MYGNRWCDIAKEVDGRTDNAIKNRYNSNLSKRLNEPAFVKLLEEEQREQAAKQDQDDAVLATEEREDSVTLENLKGVNSNEEDVQSFGGATEQLTSDL